MALRTLLSHKKAESVNLTSCPVENIEDYADVSEKKRDNFNKILHDVN